VLCFVDSYIYIKSRPQKTSKLAFQGRLSE
jgi:hypothetical protein